MSAEDLIAIVKRYVMLDKMMCQWGNKGGGGRGGKLAIQG